MSIAGADLDLLQYWFEELEMTVSEYREPILETDTVEFIKFACDLLKQDSHVFTMTVDMVEACVHIKNARHEKIEDQLLLICAVIFISSKHVGEQSDLKARYVNVLYERISKQRISTEQVRLAEINVLKMLDQRLPLYTKIDDLKVFLENYVKPKLRSKLDLTDLCVHILNLVYVHYKSLFYKLKSFYDQNPSAFNAFKQIVTNRFYLPCGILICAIRLVQPPGIDVDHILAELGVISNIHHNHVEFLANQILSLISCNDGGGGGG